MPCPVCGASVKSWESTRHVNSKRHQAALKEQKGAIPNGSEPPIAVVAPSGVVDQRINQLEISISKVDRRLEYLLDEMSRVQQDIRISPKLGREPAKTAPRTPIENELLILIKDAHAKHAGRISGVCEIADVIDHLKNRTTLNERHIKDVLYTFHLKGIVELSAGQSKKGKYVKGDDGRKYAFLSPSG